MIAALVAVVPTAAPGKGASEATIAGPGLDDPISLVGEGQYGGEALMHIAEEAGFFPAVFTRIPDPMREERPAGALGPKYTVTYVMPGPNNEEDRLLQDLYPYASPSPVSYVEPGQRFWTTEQTRGGWFVATATLKDLLVVAGLPETPPATDAPSEFPWRIAAPLTLLLAAAAVGIGVALLMRRRPQTA
jgi:hypothetical protein